jgi:hypothetical protein
MLPNVYPIATIDALAELLARGVVRHFEQVAKQAVSPDVSGPAGKRGSFGTDRACRHGI